MARRKNVKRIDPRYFLDETVNRNDDGSAGEEGLEEAGWSLSAAEMRKLPVRKPGEGSAVLDAGRAKAAKAAKGRDRKWYEPPDPSDPGWPWEPGESVEGNRPHPYEAAPVLGSIRRRPGETREEYERRIEKGQHRAQYRHPDPGELDPYELEEANWADEPEANKPWSYQRSSAGGYSPQVVTDRGRGRSDEPDHSGESSDQRRERRRLGKRKQYLDRLPWSAEVADEMNKWEAEVKAAGLSTSQLEEGGPTEGLEETGPLTAEQ